MSDKTTQDKKREYGLKMMRNRGKVAEEWLKINILTKKTLPEFNRLMKKADIDYKSNKEQNMKKLYNAIKSSKDWKIVRINGKLYVKRRKTWKEQ